MRFAAERDSIRLAVCTAGRAGAQARFRVKRESARALLPIIDA